jgi:hypothetical protein
MCKQDYVDRAKLSPARTFKSPMDVVHADDIEPADKLVILKAWEADERALLRAEDEGMGGGEHAHLHEVQAALAQLSEESSSATKQPSASESPNRFHTPEPASSKASACLATVSARSVGGMQ